MRRTFTKREVLGHMFYAKDCKYDSLDDFYIKASDKEIEVINCINDSKFYVGEATDIRFIGSLMLFLDQMSYTDPCNTEFENMTVKELFEILCSLPEYIIQYNLFKDHSRKDDIE
jgi:hypothetical protein